MPARDPSQGSQIPGLWVDKDGSVRREVDGEDRTICRWSLRLASDPPSWKTRWSPEKPALKDNDEVQLFCHSFGAGSFVEGFGHPAWAPAVYAGSGDVALTVQKLDPSKLNPKYGELNVFNNALSVLRSTLSSGNTTSETVARQEAFMQRLMQESVFDTTLPGAAVLTKSFDELLATVRDYDRTRANDEQRRMINLLNSIIAIGVPGDTHNWPRSIMRISSAQVAANPLDYGPMGQAIDDTAWQLSRWRIEDEMKDKQAVNFLIRFEDS